MLRHASCNFADRAPGIRPANQMHPDLVARWQREQTEIHPGRLLARGELLAAMPATQRFAHSRFRGGPRLSEASSRCAIYWPQAFSRRNYRVIAPAGIVQGHPAGFDAEAHASTSSPVGKAAREHAPLEKYVASY
jgi:hypothetical protein